MSSSLERKSNDLEASAIVADLFMVLFVLLAQLAPVALFPIFYKFEPLDDEELRRRLVVLSERAGTRVRGVYRWKLSEKSKKANAALTGLGATRRIILADTLLDNYTSDEIEAVLAHKLGHHVHRHILKSIFVQAAITLFGFWPCRGSRLHCNGSDHSDPMANVVPSAPRTSLTGGLVDGIASSSTGTRCKGGKSAAIAAAEMADNATTAINVCFIDLSPVSSIFSECCSATFFARGLRRVKRVIL